MGPVNSIVIVGLAALWIWVLGRPFLANVFDRSRRDPVGHFNRELSVLGSGSSQGSRLSSARLGGGPAAMGRRSAQRRRRQILLGLAIAAVVSLVLALVFGGNFVVQNIIIDVLLVAYVALAARAGATLREQGSKVTRLNVEHIPNPVYVRAANGR